MTSLDSSASGSRGIPPVPRWVGPVFAVLGAATIPWTAYLAMSLPAQARSHHYRAAWVGFDIMLVLVLLATAYFAWRGWRHVGILASSTATMLVVDAWFDVTTSRRADVPQAILSAVFVELPLAVVCGWIALHVDQVIERRLRQFARRAARLQRHTGAAETAGAAIRTAHAGAASAELGGRIAEAGTHTAERALVDAEDQERALGDTREQARALGDAGEQEKAP
jgi:hypothetical protein